VLRARVDDLAVERMWRDVERRRDAAALPRTQARPMRLALCVAVAALGLSLLFAVRLPARVGPSDAPGPLHLAGGGDPGVMATGPGTPGSFAFDDGSTMTLSPDARLETLENDGHAFITLLKRGATTFHVQPGGPRRWSIECGLATVEVVGTRFEVERAPSRVRVNVEHGSVLVRGERVRDRVQTLIDGQSLEVSDATPSPQAGVDPSTLPQSTAGQGAPVAAPAATAGRPASPASVASGQWRDLAQRGEYAQAYGTLGTEGVQRVSESGAVGDLLAVADVARLSGHPADAVGPLARVASEHPDDPRAPLASFMLGRLELDALGDASRAANAFRGAIVLGIPGTLLEDAYARLVEACARAGDRDAARRAAAEYSARFPGGSRASVVARWAGGR
jgi:transmembrane sensor